MNFPALAKESITKLSNVYEHRKSPAILSFRIQSPMRNDWLVSQSFIVRGWVVSKSPVANAILLNPAGDFIARVGLSNKFANVYQKYKAIIPELEQNIAFEFQVLEKDLLTSEQTKANLILYLEFADGTLEKASTLEFDKTPLDLPHFVQEGIGPHFFIGGAMKGATSAIYQYLLSHPSVVARMPKEIHFFSKQPIFQQGWGWYLSQFHNARARHEANGNDHRLLMGDASPSYLSSAIAAEQISRTLPQAKIIFSLRDPAHRAISHYFHQIKRVGDEKRDSAEVFSEENIAKTTQIFQELGYDIETLQNNAFWHTLRYFFEGLYGIHIAKWQALTVAENLLVLNYHRLETEPESYVKSIFHFLGLDMPASLEINKVYANEYPDLPIEIINRLKAFFEPYNQTLFKLLGVKEHWF